MKCPRCGGHNCQFVSSTKVHSSLFGWSEACCGYICLGPAGILCGFCGSDVTTKTKEYWICNDCGAKFKASDVAQDMKNVDIQVKFYYDDPARYPEYKNSRPVQVMQAAFENNVEFQELLSKTVIRNMESEQLRDLKNQFDKNILAEQILLMALIEKDGLIMSMQGIFLGNRYMPYSSICSIMKCKNSIFINQMEIEFASPQVAAQFWVILRMILTEANYYENDDFTDILERLHALPMENGQDINHYSSQKEYADYVKQLSAQKFNEYKRTHPNEIRRYQKKKEEMEEKESNGAILMLAVPLVAGIIFWIAASLIVGVMAAAAVFFAEFLIAEYMEKEGRHLEYRKEYLPGELIALMEENERDPLGKKGNIHPQMYADWPGKGLENTGTQQLLLEAPTPYREPQRKNLYCSQCGSALPQGAVFCPHCGKESRTNSGGKHVL
ncbi:MAG: zinc ribbon domain-containing protein [Eubacteriales bacterium]|nr:zinc ribbon domain-containing protein [Eubacteriales bacterium]